MRRAIDDLTGRDLVPVLDATPDGRAVYRALGFEDSWGFHRLTRSQRPGAPETLPAPAGVTIRALTEQDWQPLTRLRRRGLRRRTRRRARGLRGRLPAAELIAERDGRIAGFLLGRDGRLAAQLGPLLAEDDAIACALLARALAAIDGPLFVDLADAKADVRSFLSGARL